MGNRSADASFFNYFCADQLISIVQPSLHTFQASAVILIVSEKVIIIATGGIHVDSLLTVCLEHQIYYYPLHHFLSVTRSGCLVGTAYRICKTHLHSVAVISDLLLAFDIYRAQLHRGRISGTFGIRSLASLEWTIPFCLKYHKPASAVLAESLDTMPTLKQVCSNFSFCSIKLLYNSLKL